MHDILRERLSRQIETLPEEQLYQVLDYIEFLSSKYARGAARPATSGLQRFGERLEDKLRVNRVGFDVIRGTLNVVGAADRVVSGLTEAGRSILRDVGAPSPSEQLPPQPQQPPQAQIPAPENRSTESASRRPDILIDD
jgi:hypothetical protein